MTKYITFAGVTFGLLVYIYILDSKIDNLKYQILVKNVNLIECDESIKEQNKVINTLAIDYQKNLEEFEEYKKLPPKVKIKKEVKIIYRDVNVSISREERSLEDYKNIERNTYMLDWNK